MLRRSWSRWLLAFVLLLALPAVYFMACVLSEGFNKSPYGPTEVLQVYVAQFRVWFGASQTQGLLKSFGFAATIISIACGLFKTLQIFEANLPTLLKNYLKKYSQHIFRERDVMLEIVAATTDSAPAKAGLFARRSDRRRQRILNRYIDSIDTAQVNSRSDFAKLNDSYDVATLAKDVRSYELATAHFIRGKLHAIAADSGVGGSREQARGEFKKAAEYDLLDTRDEPRDPRIHRAFVEQLDKSNILDDLIPAIKGWIAAATSRNDNREQGLALHRLGDVHFVRSKDPSLTLAQVRDRLGLARRSLDKSINLFQKNPPTSATAGRDPELAKTFELLGNVRVEMQNFRIAASQYRSAKSIYQELKDSESSQRMDQRLAEIGMAANGASQAPPNSPGLEVVLAFVKLGEALKSTGKTAESRGYLQSGRATLVKLNVPTDITQEIKEQILAEVDELLEPDDDEPDSSNPPNSATNLP